jgi:hypothetical protein
MATGHEFINLADLASARVGGRAIATNDDFFAAKSNLVKPEPAVFIPGKYTTKGKWMDGWESRRRRVPGHDWCIVLLGMRGIVHGVNVDTSHFTGNYPSHCSIEAVDMPAGIKPSLHAVDGAPWTTLLEKTALRGNGENLFPISDRRPWTHVRLSIYPDGGVARLRVYGEVAVDWPTVGTRAVDLALITNGGLFLAASDLHYGTRGALTQLFDLIRDGTVGCYPPSRGIGDLIFGGAIDGTDHLIASNKCTDITPGLVNVFLDIENLVVDSQGGFMLDQCLRHFTILNLRKQTSPRTNNRFQHAGIPHRFYRSQGSLFVKGHHHSGRWNSMIHQELACNIFITTPFRNGR